MLNQNSRLNDALSWAHPLIKEWFLNKIGTPTDPQVLGWPAILSKKSTLIASPTGSGKTLSAFLVCMNHLVKKSVLGKLEDKAEVLYISPLKALSNDIHKNLLQPLSEIEALANEQSIKMQKIKVAVRTGDTKTSERKKMIKNPPHILVTTPESLYILLTAEKSRKMLSNIKTIIIDEVHALVNNKRGTHLALSLERLEALTRSKPIRIGLSATQKPMDVVGKFLVGSKRKPPIIINTHYKRKIEIEVKVPKTKLGPIATNDMWNEIYEALASIGEHYRTTLVFVNTRKLAERVSHQLCLRLGEDKVAAHHGSLSMKIRHEAEHKLKKGELKVLVATASLELGIDIGSIDLVCQLGTPRSINVALQRFGRAGHWHGGISKGILFATTRDELLECAALVHAIKNEELDELILPDEPIDILTQQIIASCATGDWKEKELYHLITKAYPYRNLSYEMFIRLIEMLSHGIAGSRGRYSAYLFRDQVNGLIKARKGCRLTAITSGGAIPENGLFTVISEADKVMVGTLDEDFAIESNRDDIILLGTTSWRILRVESIAGRVMVENAKGAPPNVPFWRGEAPGRTQELSHYVSNLRRTLNDLLSHDSKLKKALNWLKINCHLLPEASEQLIHYILETKAILGNIPSQKTIIAERFFDETGGMQLIIHAPFGMRINKAWGLALRKRFCRSFNFELQAAATDNGLNISLAEQHSFPLNDVFHFLHPNTLKEVLTQAILQSPLFKTRWRWTATRSLSLVRFRRGKKVPPNVQRILSDDLLAAIFPESIACQDNLAGKEIELPDHPLINEAMKDCLQEALDFKGLLTIIQNIINGTIQCVAVDTIMPSPFAAEILNANPYAFLDDAPLEERRARAIEMRRTLPKTVLEDIGNLDQAAITEVQVQSWPDVRNLDELHDALQTFIAFPVDLQNKNFKADWRVFVTELKEQGRIGEAALSKELYWFAAEKKHFFTAIYKDADIIQDVKDLRHPKIVREEAILEMIRGWMLHLGPTTSQELCHILNLKTIEVDPILLQLESTGLILRGHFRPHQTEIEWCERRLLARIHKLTIDRLRKEIEPVSIEQFMSWLLSWQHLQPGTQLQGEEGLLEIIRQLQGFELPANAWETKIFSKRLQGYDKDMLDKLCMTGRIGWGRLSKFSTNPEKKYSSMKVNLKSTVPITFFVEGENDWRQDFEFSLASLLELSTVAQEIYAFLKAKGASYFKTIAKSINYLDSQIENALWELITVGAITADSFDNLRALIYSNRRLSPNRRLSKMHFNMGRWSLLYEEDKDRVDSSAKNQAACWMLLKRYGIVFREILKREKNIPSWRELLIEFRKLEDRGEIRGGRFINKLVGEQFALSYSVDSLRAFKNKPSNTDLLQLSAADPLNLLGILIPGERISPLSKTNLIFKNGSIINSANSS